LQNEAPAVFLQADTSAATNWMMNDSQSPGYEQ